jgi:GT2 family glycosyltransferase
MISPLGELRQMLRVKLAARRGVIGDFVARRLTRRERFVDWVSGGCLLVRRDEAVAAGLFDERYFLYEEDVDFCAALRARGGVILYTPRARVLHRRGTSVQQSRLPSTLHYDRSHVAFYRKHHPGWEPLLRVWMRARGRNVR